MLSHNLEKFIHPSVPVNQLPKEGDDLYVFLDSGFATKAQVGVVVRNRYPQTVAILDSRLAQKIQKYHSPSDLKYLIGLIGAFNYTRDMNVIKRDGTIDREVTPKIMLSSSAAIQVLDHARVTSQSKVLEIFSGVGYFSFFLALQSPEVLDCVDLITPEMYDLDTTFKKAYDWIYQEIPQVYRPEITAPSYKQIDSQKLEEAVALVKIRTDYTHVFLHPPFGLRSKLLLDLSGEDCKKLWINSLIQIGKVNKTDCRTFSVVPSEWISDLKLPLGHINPVTLNLRETRLLSLTLFMTEVKK